MDSISPFLKKLGLVDSFSTKVAISQKEFVARLRKHVDEGNTSAFSGAFDVLSSSKNEYKGHVGRSEFKIKRRKRLFEVGMSALAKGTFRQSGEYVVIETEVDGFKRMMIPFYVIGFIMYSVFIFSMLFMDDGNGPGSFVFLPFILFHASLMFGMPYLMMRRSVKKMKYELEREFHYMASKQVIDLG
ncbi:hypothetical protein SAMN05421823_103413 [Catalinimonas alkaloidigena]|uniref:Uncharacterized protein n=1 Tax=Catalinimonas alkaloidigena TaxID=1075417 RepID=A0A1G9EBG4_9BACT|nr:hypothetical protein [Catalinimonas alkaloidigena]SDK73500.1 hypothetical protein SAMN05421823_103413 [Catalinimonas alkaloidigena]